MTPPCRSVLIVALDNVGDTVMASSVIASIRRELPEARVGLWIKEYARDLYTPGGLVDAVHSADPFWDTSPGRSEGRLGLFLRTLADLRRARYDLAFVLNTEWRRAFGCVLAGIPNRVGYDRRKSRLFLTHVLADAEKGPHFVDDHRKLLEFWFEKRFELPEAVPSVAISSERRAAADQWIVERGWRGAPLAVFHPFAGDPFKCWPTERWQALIRAFAQAHPDFRFAALCSESEKEAISALASVVQERLAVVAGMPLGFSAAIIARARLFVGGDSGPGHIAAALGVPVISLFGESNWARCRPIGRGVVRIVEQTPLADLAPERVMSEMEAVFSVASAHPEPFSSCAAE